MPGITVTEVTPGLLIPAVVAVTLCNSVRPLSFSHRMGSCASCENVSVHIY